MVTELNSAFTHNKYLFRRKFFKLFGGEFRVYDEIGNLVFFSKQKAFKLKEDFRVYSDESQRQELLIIKTPQIFDIGATYNVKDATTGEPVGAIRRKGIKSIFKDEWTFLSNSGHEIGILTEKSTRGAILSRFTNLVPQNYIIKSNNRQIAEIEQQFKFILEYIMRISQEPQIDRRLLIATGILLMGIERREHTLF
ncbi:MAG: hypothetical protein KAR87_00660 [Candidatus Aenigmarchaeota archaeon]|nr:hypothetical protein [Candidatus Aenigmarchaeota archaeon]